MIIEIPAQLIYNMMTLIFLFIGVVIWVITAIYRKYGADIVLIGVIIGSIFFIAGIVLAFDIRIAVIPDYPNINQTRSN